MASRAGRVPSATGRDRRRATRTNAAIPARIDTSTRPKRIALSRNISRTGALLGTPSRYSIGERAVVTFQLTADVIREAAGRIIRLEIDEGDRTGLWRYLMVVEFDAPLPEGFLVEAADLGF